MYEGWPEPCLQFVGWSHRGVKGDHRRADTALEVTEPNPPRKSHPENHTEYPHSRNITHPDDARTAPGYCLLHPVDMVCVWVHV